MIDVTMPQLGESVETGTVTRWLKKPGESVAVDEPLFEVGSDKVTMEIPSLVAGRLRTILVAEGDEVPVGTILARIESDSVTQGTSARVTLSLSKGESKSSTAGEDESRMASPSLTLRQAQGDMDDRTAVVSPVVQRLAREHRVDLAQVRGSAEGGRVTKRDVLAYVAGLGTQLAGKERSEPLSPLRKTAIARLSAAQKSAINVVSVIEIDMERVEAARTARGLTYLPFVALAVVDALKAYPVLNSSLDEDGSALLYHDAIHLGIAVDLDEHGLVVPVVRDAQTRSLDELARSIGRVADAARARSLRSEDFAGSTFTLTNNGVFGTLMTAPVINLPNVAILSLDAVEERPVVIDHMIAIRRRMYCSMTWDHRAFDGSTAGRFLAHVKRVLETADWTAR